MDTATTVTFIATAISSGIVGSSLTQLAKTYIPGKYRSLFALGVTAVVSAIGAAVVWAIAGDFTWAAFSVQLLASIGVAQGVYAIIKPVIPGAGDYNVDALVKQVKDLYDIIDKLTAEANDTKQSADEVKTAETKANVSIAK